MSNEAMKMPVGTFQITELPYTPDQLSWVVSTTYYTASVFTTRTLPYDTLPPPYSKDELGIEWQAELAPGVLRTWQDPVAPIIRGEQPVEVRLQASVPRGLVIDLGNHLKRGWLTLTPSL